MTRYTRIRLRHFLFLTALALAAPGNVHGQVENSPLLAQGYAKEMLQRIHKDVIKYYYDPAFHGVDLEQAAERARTRIAASRGPVDSFRAIAEYLGTLKDSHTAFVPPLYGDVIDYGFEVRFFGDSLYVTRVAPGTPAAAAGLRRGDRVVRLERQRPDRATLGDWLYLHTVVAPVADIELTVVGVEGAQRKVIVAPLVQEAPAFHIRDWRVKRRLNLAYDSLRDALAHVYGPVDDSVLIWRMPAFHSDDGNIGKLVGEASKHSGLILDLRGNSGGSPETLKKLAGGLFDRPVTIGTQRTRTKTEPLVSKPGKQRFEGRLVVLVDSESASAAEVFARLVQIEKRGAVVGDRTAGAVMLGRFRTYTVGVDRVWTYGASITEADVTMSDGARLEGVGVQPDHTVKPTSAQVAAGADPALAFALELVGVTRTPEEAGRWGREVK